MQRPGDGERRVAHGGDGGDGDPTGVRWKSGMLRRDSENHPELDGKHSDLSGKEWGLMMIYVLLVIACDSYFRWDVW